MKILTTQVEAHQDEMLTIPCIPSKEFAKDGAMPKTLPSLAAPDKSVFLANPATLEQLEFLKNTAETRPLSGLLSDYQTWPKV